MNITNSICIHRKLYHCFDLLFEQFDFNIFTKLQKIQILGILLRKKSFYDIKYTKIVIKRTGSNSKMREIIKQIEEFNKERDWDQFHSPENLAKSIAIESGELLECFQWNSDNYNKEEVCEELADVFTYCIQMAMKLGVDPEEIILKKLEKTKKKYPVEKAKGVSTKYNKL